MSKNFLRIAKHLSFPAWRVGLAFPKATLKAIADEIARTEALHDGELRFVVVGGLDLARLWRGVSARQHAVEVFSQLRVWDTEHNSGVLIYVQLVDRKVEILADRGISAGVAQAEWDAICREVEQAFRKQRYEEGALSAVRRVGALLAAHFPARPDNPNELPNRPVLL